MLGRKIINLILVVSAGLPALWTAGYTPVAKGQTSDHAAEAAAAAGHDHGGDVAVEPLPPGVNAVQNEMRVLHDAFQEATQAVINNQLSHVVPAIQKVDAARKHTVEALNKGEIKLPKNGDKLDEFVQEDEAFHGELIKFVQAANANDLQAASKQAGVVLNTCTQCHLKFRF